MKKFAILKHLLAIGLIGLVFTGITSCKERDKIIEVNLENREKLNILNKEATLLNENPLRIAIGSMITPIEGYVYYRQLLDYIGEKIGRHIHLIDRKNYTEINNLLKSGYVDVAFVCSGPYVDGHNEFGLELLVAPQVNGKAEYHSYIIVHADSPVKTFDGLRGKTFAFADPKSNTGKLVPTYMLARMNETPDFFFSRYSYTYAHDKSIKAVARKIVSGAAVHSLIWDFYNKTYPEVTSMTKIIDKSPPYGIPPVVVSSGIDPETRNRLRNVFLSIHEDEKGRKILEGMNIDKFVVIDDKNYDSIREMIAMMDQKSKEE